MNIYKTEDGNLAFEVSEDGPLIVANLDGATQNLDSEAALEENAGQTLQQASEDPFVALMLDQRGNYDSSELTLITHEEAEQIWSEYHN